MAHVPAVSERPMARPAREPSGRIVIFWLFVGLAIATAGVLLYFATLAPASARPRIYASMAGDLALPVIAWFLFKAINKRRDRVT
jgi:hypothetical protein